MMTRIYLDHAATSPIVDKAKKYMLYVLEEVIGNPSSSHLEGRKARSVLEEYRSKIAEMLGASPSEVIFTSGATESNNLALTACRKHLITSKSEHKAILEPSELLGARTTLLTPREDGVLEVPESVFTSAAGGMVSLMWVNNETGAITDVDKIAKTASSHGYLFHTDAVQALKCQTFAFDSSEIDLMSLSAHKIGGPKGIGVLLKKPNVTVYPLFKGGGQEHGIRPGTENLIGIAGLLGALEAQKQQENVNAELSLLSMTFFDEIRADLGERIRRNGPSDPGKRAPHILYLTFFSSDGKPVDAEIVLHQLDHKGIAASTGSACTSGAIEPSHVLIAMGISRDEAAGSLRFSFSNTNTLDEVRYAARQITFLLN